MNNLKSCPTLQVSRFHIINNYYDIFKNRKEWKDLVLAQIER